MNEEKYNDVPNFDNIVELMKKITQGENMNDPMTTALLNDQRLYAVAVYDITQGNISKKEYTPEQIADKFSELKMLVLKKESTLAELETLVYSKYGVIEQPRTLAPKEEKMPIGFSL